MNIEYVNKNTIFETIVGSQAYGISNPNSDIDKAGVMIPGFDYFFGLKKFEQFNGYEKEDKVIYDLRKALNLIADNNPNCMDLLWVPERCIVKMSPYWKVFVENRHLFVSKRCRYTFSGYAIAQLHRIKVHRKFLQHPPKQPPSRIEAGLPETPIFPTSQLKAVCQAAMVYIMEEEKQNFLDQLDGIYGDYVIPLLARFLIPAEKALALEYLQMGIKSQAKAFITVGAQYIKDEYIDQARKEVIYYDMDQEWKQYLAWKKGRNPARADLEAKFGFDCKHASHLVRLCRTGEEILRTGQVNVDRTNIDAEELKAIRNGAWTYEQIEAYAQRDALFDELYKTTTLPRSSDIEKINELCVEVVKHYFADVK